MGCSESGIEASREGDVWPAEAAAPTIDAANQVDAATAEAIEVRLAPRARVSISFDDWRDAGNSPRVIDGGASAITSSVDGSVLTLDALRSASGTTTIEVGSTSGATRARVNVTVDARPWAYVCDAAYETDFPLADAETEVRIAEAWSSYSGRTFGTQSSTSGMAAFAWSPGERVAGLPIPASVTGSTARHRSGTSVWGSVISAGVSSPAYFDVATKLMTVLPWKSAAEIYFESAGTLAGARREGGAVLSASTKKRERPLLAREKSTGSVTVQCRALDERAFGLARSQVAEHIGELAGGSQRDATRTRADAQALVRRDHEVFPPRPPRKTLGQVPEEPGAGA